MTTQIFTFYDRIAMQSEGVFHARNEADAQRTFLRRFKDRDDADDYSLLHLGSMDHDTSTITLLDVPNQIHITLPKPPKGTE